LIGTLIPHYSISFFYSGGTAKDYAGHVSTLEDLAETYAFMTGQDQKSLLLELVSNIGCTMTDQCATNHTAIAILEEKWGKSLQELFCHLHPLDSIASAVRQTIERCESTEPVTKAVFGSDCAAANLVLGINKMRYKMGKGDPSGFRLFLLQKKLPLLLIPRYRGNRLHVLFHIASPRLSSLQTDYLPEYRNCGWWPSSEFASRHEV
jgi:hypothetical protein